MKSNILEKTNALNYGNIADKVSHFLFDEGKPTQNYTKDEWVSTLLEMKNGNEGVKTHWFVAGALTTLCTLPAVVRNTGEMMARNPKVVKAIGATYLGLILLGIAKSEVKAMTFDDNDDADDLGDDNGNHNSPSHLHIDVGRHKDVSYLVMDQVEKKPFEIGPTTRLVDSLGMTDVDRVVERTYTIQPFGSDINAYPDNAKLEYAASRLNSDSTKEGTGFSFLPPDMVAIEFQDTDFVQVSPAANGGRGGVTHGNVVEASSIIVGRESNSGQLFAVLAVDGNGNLTGVKTGLEPLEPVPMVFGPTGTNFENTLGVWVGGEFEPLIKNDGTIFIPTETEPKPMIPAGSVDVGMLKDYIPPQYANVSTMFNEHDYTINVEDGTVSRDGVVVNGFTVDKNGNMTMEVNGEQVAVEMTDVELDGDDGMRVKGKIYDIDTDSWIEYESPAESAVTKILEDNNIKSDTYTQTVVDGVVTVIDKETGKVMMQSSESGVLHGIEFATKIAANSCEPTPYKPDQSGRISSADGPALREYLTEMKNELSYRSGSLITYNIVINREMQCWGFANRNNFLYRDKDRVPHRLPLISLTDDQLMEFLFSR